MTTVFGIKHPLVKSAVLVADRQTTYTMPETGLPVRKSLRRKLWTGKRGNFCFGHAGMADKETYDFFQELCDGKFDIERITKRQYFPELRKLNLKKMGKTVADPQNTSGIVLITRFNNKPELYTCFPLGAVQKEKEVWTTIGSGGKKIHEYMGALQIMSEAKNYVGSEKDPTIRDVIKVGLEAVRRAQSQDIYSDGLDMLVCTPKKIIDHYAELGDDFAKKLKRIQRQYK